MLAKKKNLGLPQEFLHILENAILKNKQILNEPVKRKPGLKVMSDRDLHSMETRWPRG